MDSRFWWGVLIAWLLVSFIPQLSAASLLGMIKGKGKG